MDRVTSGPRWLSVEEKQQLRRDMQESSLWTKAELRRRREEIHQKNLSTDRDSGENESET